MNDLRVYIYPARTGANGTREVFYSRRADGPFYRWLYEEEAGRWHFTRVHLSRLTLKVLSLANRESVPNELQRQLFEHYLE